MVKLRFGDIIQVKMVVTMALWHYGLPVIGEILYWFTANLGGTKTYFCEKMGYLMKKNLMLAARFFQNHGSL